MRAISQFLLMLVLKTYIIIGTEHFLTIYLLPSLRFILFPRLTNNLCGSNVLIFSELMNIVSISDDRIFIDLIILSYTFFVIYFDKYSQHVVLNLLHVIIYISYFYFYK